MRAMPYSPRRAEAIRWARELLDRPRFLVLDTETTGLGPTDEPCAIGIVDQDGTIVLESLLRPHKPIPWQVTRIHGIRDRDVANAPTFPELYPRIAALLAGDPLVVYNLDFDRRMLDNCHRLYGLPRLRYREAHCAMRRYADFYGAGRWQKLGNACLQCGIEPTRTHAAVADSLLTLGIVRHMAAAAP